MRWPLTGKLPGIEAGIPSRFRGMRELQAPAAKTRLLPVIRRFASLTVTRSCSASMLSHRTILENLDTVAVAHDPQRAKQVHGIDTGIVGIKKCANQAFHS